MAIKMLDLARQRAALEPGLTEATLAVFDHGQFINGPEVKALETALADYVGVPHAIGCANGTDALQILLRAMGVGPGQVVFVPALTYVATAEAVALVGATPVFVDVDLDTATMDPESLAAAIDMEFGMGARGAAVIAVDLFSLPARYAALEEICRANSLHLIIDTAQSFGTETGSGRACGQGDAAATSFYPSKSLGAFGDGGAMFARDPEIAARARAIANHGVSDGLHTYIGTNSRLDSMQAAILLAKLAVFDSEIAARRRIAARFSEALAGHVAVPAPPAGSDPCWAYYAVRAERREDLIAHLAERGIPSVPYYKVPIHKQPGFHGSRVAPGGLPNTDVYSKSLLCLPLHPYMTEDEEAQVIDAVISFYT